MAARIGTMMIVLAFAAACSSSDEEVVETQAVVSVATTHAPPPLDTPVDVTLDSIDVGGDVATFAPAGWSVAADGLATPPPSSGLSAVVGWRIDDRCVDDCQERSGPDWAAFTSAADIDPLLAQEQLTVERDESSQGRRLLEVVSDDGILSVLIVRWVDGASAYLKCDLTGEQSELGDLIPAFEFACDNTRAALTG